MGICNVQFRPATTADFPALAKMNQALIQDEGHRNPMSLPELEERMKQWLNDEYQAIVFESESKTSGYCLFRENEEHAYLRQLYVCPEFRRQGIARAALTWLKQRTCPKSKRIRVEVLVHNEVALQFWRAIGFLDYCITLETPL